MSWKDLHDLLGGDTFDERPPLDARFNIAPSSLIQTAMWHNSRLMITPMTWGLKPSWAKSLLINAQSEKYVAPDRGYWAEFTRCVIPASGFYEWQTKPGGNKQPMYIQLKGGAPFLFAGLHRLVQSDTAGATPHCVIVTTYPNAIMRPIHKRMPVILRPEHHRIWADPESDRSDLTEIVQPVNPDEIEAYPVDASVGNTKNDGPDLIRPIEI
jgi:putative SOS response-associated peptidase YedK